jgi:hypothetical protein
VLGVFLERLVHLVERLHPEMGEHGVGGASEAQVAAVPHHRHPVAQGERARRVRHDDHAASLLGDPPQDLHEPPLEPGVEAGRRLV